MPKLNKVNLQIGYSFLGKQAITQLLVVCLSGKCELHDALYLQKAKHAKKLDIKKGGVNYFDNFHYIGSMISIRSNLLQWKWLRNLAKFFVACFVGYFGRSPCTEHSKLQKLVMHVHIINQQEYCDYVGHKQSETFQNKS